jgi:hypothetical protein
MVFFRATGLRKPCQGDPTAYADADKEIGLRVFTIATALALIE